MRAIEPTAGKIITACEVRGMTLDFHSKAIVQRPASNHYVGNNKLIPELRAKGDKLRRAEGATG